MPHLCPCCGAFYFFDYGRVLYGLYCERRSLTWDVKAAWDCDVRYFNSLRVYRNAFDLSGEVRFNWKKRKMTRREVSIAVSDFHIRRCLFCVRACTVPFKFVNLESRQITACSNNNVKLSGGMYITLPY